MIAIDTDEKLDWLLNALEDGEIVLDNRKRTKEEWDEISRELAEYRATHPKTPAKDMVLA
jgi:hypothetical protein